MLTPLAIVASFAALCSAVTTNCGSGQVCPVIVQARTDPASGNCSANATTIRSQIVSGLSSQISGVSANLVTAINAKYLGLTATTAAQTCLQIKQARPSATSGNYWILKSSTPVQVYCEMSLVCDTSRGCSSVAGGWLQVAKLNMSNTSQSCPVGASGVGNAGLFVTDVTNGVRSCRRMNTAGSASDCNLGFAEVLGGFPYQEVCGRVLGYQWGSPDGVTVTRTLNEAYADGVSLTSTPDPAVDSSWWQHRTHVWSYIAHFSEDTSAGCPCCTGYSGGAVPSYIGSNYFCESGLPVGSTWTSNLYSGDQLWDSKQCGNLEAPCCSGPWFCNKLASSTSNRFLEVRLCSDGATTDEDVSMTVMELYVR